MTTQTIQRSFLNMFVNVNLFLFFGLKAKKKKRDSTLPHIVLRISFTKLIKKMKIGRKKSLIILHVKIC